MPQPPGRTPHSACFARLRHDAPQAPLRCPGGEDQPPAPRLCAPPAGPSEAPARGAVTNMAKEVKGVLGTKLGMTQVFNDQGKVVPVTVVAAGPCVVTAVRTAPQDGYAAVQLGYGEIDPRRVTKPVAGHFAKAGVTPRRYLVELRTDDADQYT